MVFVKYGIKIMMVEGHATFIQRS